MKKGIATRPVLLALLLLVAWGLGFQLTTDFSKSDAGIGWGVVFVLVVVPIFLSLLLIAAYRLFRNKKRSH